MNNCTLILLPNFGIEFSTRNLLLDVGIVAFYTVFVTFFIL